MKNPFTRAVERFMVRVRLFLRLWRRPFWGALLAAVVPVMWIFVLHGREEMIHGRILVTSMEALSYDLPVRVRVQ